MFSRIVVSNPSYGRSPSGFTRIHVELRPSGLGKLVGYDPRVLIMKPRKPGAKGTRDLVPHNVSARVIELQSKVQRSIDKTRVAQMVDYLRAAVEESKFADWGAIELVTAAAPEHRPDGAALDADADYFIADGQHRYCALLDFLQEYPQYHDSFTQGVTISVLPDAKMIEWAGQKFHDHNYFSVAVRPGKALNTDSRDPVNALAKSLDAHPDIKKAGGIAYERDQLLAGDSRFTAHSVIHRFVRGFLFGRPGLDKGVDSRAEIDSDAAQHLSLFISALALLLPWASPERDAFLTRTSVVLSALAVVGHDLFSLQMSSTERAERLKRLATVDWRRTNLALVGVVGSEKAGLVMPASSRPAIDSTIRYLRELLGLLTHKAN